MHRHHPLYLGLPSVHTCEHAVCCRVSDAVGASPEHNASEAHDQRRLSRW